MGRHQQKSKSLSGEGRRGGTLAGRGSGRQQGSPLQVILGNGGRLIAAPTVDLRNNSERCAEVVAPYGPVTSEAGGQRPPLRRISGNRREGQAPPLRKKRSGLGFA